MKKIEKFEKIENLGGDLDAQLQNLPASPGVYLFKGENAKLLYVGKAKVLRHRVRSYFQRLADHSPRIGHLVSQIKTLEYLNTGTEVEALLLENNLIKKLKPKYNIRLRDDKTYPYIRIDSGHSSPRAYLARKPIPGGGNEYFGPFPDSSGVRRILSISSKVFQLRDCRDHDFANRSRPCLSYQMGQCTAPCVELVSPADYGKQVDRFRDFLKGSSGDLESHLQNEMLEASDKLEFETAARLRDQLAAIKSVVGQNQRIEDTGDLIDKDIWAFWPRELAVVNDSEADLLPVSLPTALASEIPNAEEASTQPFAPQSAEEASTQPSVPQSVEEESLVSEEAAPTEIAESDALIHMVVLQFRSGKLIGRVYRSADLEETLPGENWKLGLLYQYYSKTPLPTQIVLPLNDVDEKEGLKILLETLPPPQTIGLVTEVKVADEGPEKAEFSLHNIDERGDWARLYELALENVKESHRVASDVKRRHEDAHRELAEILEMEKVPHRLECVDISNFQGEENVASAVVFVGGKPDKNEYRRYIIKSVRGQDDFASMREVMRRRYGKTDSPKPDLLVIDGGRGQLGVVVEMLKALDCHFPVVGLAKARTESNFRSSEVEASEERFFKPGQKNPLKIRNAAVLKLITALRDEAHRFAITFHRERRDKKRFQNEF